MYQKYLIQVLCFIIIFSIPIFSNWLFLHNSGEFLSMEDIVDKQLASNQQCIVGLAIGKHTFDEYKREMYYRIKPNVLILGSSRVMQFKQDYFSTSIINAGGAMSNINQGLSYIDEIFVKHMPKVVIIGLDYWWFHEKATTVKTTNVSISKPELQISPRDYFLPFKWLWEKKITFSTYFKLLDPFNMFSMDYTKGIGVDGILNRNGFAPDGSYIYTKLITGAEKSVDEKFEQSFNRIEHGGEPLHAAYSPYFQYGAQVSEAQFARFYKMVNMLEEKGVKVILFIPPLAPSVISKMEAYSDQYVYINELRKKLNAVGLRYSDFHDARRISSSDCEFLDGFHGGEITYVKILQSLSTKVSELRPYIKESYLTKVIHDYHDFAMVPQVKHHSSIEVDFLGIGCQKRV